MKFTIPEDKKLVFEMVIPIRWGDMDAMGHVNNTSYFRYLETIRIEWLCALGCPPDPEGEGPVILNAFCNFYRQLEHPGDVLARMYVSDLARTTFETWCTLTRTDDPDTVYAAGGATTIWVNFRCKRPPHCPIGCVPSSPEPGCVDYTCGHARVRRFFHPNHCWCAFHGAAGQPFEPPGSEGLRGLTLTCHEAPVSFPRFGRIGGC